MQSGLSQQISRLSRRPSGCSTSRWHLAQTVTGRIDVLAKVATWAKVKVTPPDGSAPAVGWTEDVAAAPVASGPGKPAAGPATVRGRRYREMIWCLGDERYREALLQPNPSPALMLRRLRRSSTLAGTRRRPPCVVWSQSGTSTQRHDYSSSDGACCEMPAVRQRSSTRRPVRRGW